MGSSNILQIYSFEGRYEINDQDGHRWFEISQYKNNSGFVWVGEQRSFNKKDSNFEGIKPYQKQYKFDRGIQVIIDRISDKLKQGYVFVGGIDQLKHPSCNYNKSPSILDAYKKQSNIITSNEGILFSDFLNLTVGVDNNKKVKQKAKNKPLYKAIAKDELAELFG